jgi:hypothetical protein
VQVHHDEGVANRIDPESCADAREGIGEALTGTELSITASWAAQCLNWVNLGGMRAPGVKRQVRDSHRRTIAFLLLRILHGLSRPPQGSGCNDVSIWRDSAGRPP